MPRSQNSRCFGVVLRATLVAAAAVVAAQLAGCHDFGDVTGSIGGSTAPADERGEAQGLRRRLRQALRAQSGREDRLDRIRPGVARADPLQRGGRRHPDGGHQGPQGFRRARRIRQGARRRRPARAGQGCADARLYAGQSAMGRHVGAGRSRRPARRSRERDAILSRRAEDRAGRAGRAHQHGAFAGAGQAIARGRAGAEAGGREPESRRADARRPRAGAGAGRKIRRGRAGRP